MKLWQFLKRWRQAYLDDKGERQVRYAKEEQARLDLKGDLIQAELDFYRRHPEEMPVPVNVDLSYVIVEVVSETLMDATLERGMFAKEI